MASRIAAALLLLCTIVSSAAAPAFEVVSIKYAGPVFPGRLPHGICELQGTRVMCEETLGFLIRRAFHLKGWEFAASSEGHRVPVLASGLGYQNSSWVDFEYYQVNAIAPAGATEATKNLMLQTMLQQRLGLRYHYEDRQMSVYELTVAKGGLKLPLASAPKSEPAPGEVKKMSMSAFKSDSVTMSDFAGGFLTNHLDRPVLDKTGVTGQYRVDLDWSDEMQHGGSPYGPHGLDPAFVSRALRKLGLNLDERKDAVKTLVVDRLNRDPTPN